MSQSFVQTIQKDWFGEVIFPPVRLALTLTETDLLFTASRATTAKPHPQSSEGKFLTELWRYDVAELFLLEPESGRYLEINLAPNGGWWACWFVRMREPSPEQPNFESLSIHAKGELSESHWEASIRLPLSLFENPATLRYNFTAIVNSPKQRFLTAFPLGPEQPDFHQPSRFQPLTSSNHS